MTSLEKIERDIAALSPQDRAALRDWLAAFEADAWDAEIEADAAAGRLDDLADRALAAHGEKSTRAL